MDAADPKALSTPAVGQEEDLNEGAKVVFDPTQFGTSGLRQSGGFILEEFLKELRGAKGQRTYREMAENDAIVGGVLFAIEMLIRQSKFTLQAADDSPAAEEAKTFAEEVLADMSTPFSSVIDEVATMFTYGHAPMEIVWKKRGGPDKQAPEERSMFNDGKIGVRKISLRSQVSVARWQIDDEGSIRGLWQQPFSGPQVYIPIEKMLLFRTNDRLNNPEGRSLLRTAYRAWYFKKRIEEIEGVGLERDLAGLPVASIPLEYMSPDADENDKKIYQAWQRMVTNVRRDKQEGVIVPSDRDSAGNPLFEFKLLSTGGSRQFDTTKVIDRYNRQIATSVLADFIFLGQQAVGSFALSSDKTALFATALGGFTQAIADVFNRHFLPRLWLLNGMDPELMPTMKPGDLEHANLAELGTYLKDLAACGMPLFPDRELENHMREQAGLPAAPEDGQGALEEDLETPGVDPQAAKNDNNQGAQ